MTGGRRAQIGAAAEVLHRFQVDQLLVADPATWTPSLRTLVTAARQAGIPVSADAIPPDADGVSVRPSGDGGAWLVTAAGGSLAIIAPDTTWLEWPAGVHAAIFTDGGPPGWSTPRVGDLAVIQVATQSRDGLPARGFLQDLGGVSVLRTDRLGTVELVASGSRFAPP